MLRAAMAHIPKSLNRYVIINCLWWLWRHYNADMLSALDIRVCEPDRQNSSLLLIQSFRIAPL